MTLPRTHIAIISILSGLTLAALGAWIFLALQSNSLRAEVLAIKTETVSKTVESTYLSSVRTVLKASKTDIAVIEKRFIRKDAVPHFIDLLESKAANAGLKADFGAIDITESANTSGRLRIQMTGSGSWINIINFIATLESLPYASKIQSVTLTKPDQKLSTWGFGLELFQYLEQTQ